MSSSTHDTTLSPAMQSAQAQWHSTSVAEKYLNAEKATRPFAQLLISKSNLSSTTSDSSEESPYILDLACGTGAAVQEIYNAVPKQVWGKMKVYGGDVSQGMVEYLAHRGKENAWVGLDTGICDGNEIGFPDNTFTHSICTFGVFIMPKSLSELFRVTKKGGWVGVTTWILFQWIPLVSRSISLMPSNPYNPSPSEITDKMFSSKPWNEPSFVLSQLSEAGFVNVQSEQKVNVAGVGSPAVSLETMQFPLNIVKAFWPEEQQDALIEEINPIILKELEGMTVDGVVQMEFEGLCAWGYKP